MSSDEILTEARDPYSRWPQLTPEEKRHVVEHITERIVLGKNDIQVDLADLPSAGEFMAKGQRNFGPALRSKLLSPSIPPPMLGEWLPGATMEFFMARRQQQDEPLDSEWHRSESGLWSLSLGFRGCRVRVFQRKRGGQFIAVTWLPGRGRSQVTLDTTSRVEARKRADELLQGRARGDAQVPPPKLTLRAMWERYQKESAAYRRISPDTQKERAGSMRRLFLAFGESKPVEFLTLTDVEAFVEMRHTGKGWPDGSTSTPVKRRTVAGDLHQLRTMLLWATRVRLEDGSWLLKEYPLRGLKLPREENPRRPIATYDRFLALRKAIGELAETAPQARGRERWVRIDLALVLAEATGARIGAINGLNWSDISFDPPQIRWRAEFDKRSRERVVPMPAALAEELQAFKAKLGARKNEWLFPTNSGEKPWPREIFNQQLLIAEEKAGLEKLDGGVWHPFVGRGPRHARTCRW